jgi:prepilin-type N-terminal cleavage/methylation domain-containing protein
MSASRRKAGFTLIELLVVVVIIGIIAAIAIPKFTNTKAKAYAASLKSDLKNLSTQQEAYFFTNETYAPSVGLLSFTPTKGVILTITAASSAGWSATSTHPAAAPLICAVYYGNVAPVAPAVTEGAVGCQ